MTKMNQSYHLSTTYSPEKINQNAISKMTFKVNSKQEDSTLTKLKIPSFDIHHKTITIT